MTGVAKHDRSQWARGVGDGEHRDRMIHRSDQLSGRPPCCDVGTLTLLRRLTANAACPSPTRSSAGRASTLAWRAAFQQRLLQVASVGLN